MFNALTIDLEDWRQLVRQKMTGAGGAPQPEVVPETEAVIELLAARNVKATFFVLGNIAEAYPALVRRVSEAGHEIASHGMSHRLVHEQSLSEFREETRRSKAILEEVVGAGVDGYRAAEFSLLEAGPGPLAILAELGFLYDSSVDPSRGSGRRRHAPAGPHLVQTAGGVIAELPVLAGDRRRARRVGGGGSFHVTRTASIVEAVARANAQARPAVIYVHPYDLPGERLAVTDVKRTLRGSIVHARHAAIHNLGRARVRATLDALLETYRFRPMRELAAAVTR